MRVGYIIGVDAGGTKTAGALMDMQGKTLFTSAGGFGHMLVDKEQAFANIEGVIGACLDARPEQKNAVIYIGAAGVGAGDAGAVMHGHLAKKFPYEIKVINDAHMSIYAQLKGGQGMLVVAGTGSIAYAKKGGTVHRAGGWGQYLGDEGGGYAISVEAMRLVTGEYDRGEKPSRLTRAIFEYLNVEDVFGMLGFLYGASKGDIAGLFSVVHRMAAEGDAGASALLDDAGRKLAALAGTLHRRVGFDGPVRLAVTGGILTNSDAVRSAFLSYAKGELGDFEFCSESVPPERGAYYLYMEENV